MSVGALDGFAIAANGSICFGFAFWILLWLLLWLLVLLAMRLIAYQLEQAQKVKPNEMIDS